MDRYVLQIMWHLTPLCNLRCLHCYEPTEREPRAEPDLVPLVADQIQELSSSYDIIRVGLLGGEPLSSPEIFFEAVQSLKDRGIRRIDVGTNGTLVNQSMAERLKDTDITMAQISLEGATAKANDPIRGFGSFDRALEGLECLKRSGVKTGIMVTVSQANFDQLEPMLRLAVEYNVGMLAFNRFLPLGGSKQHLAGSVLTPDQLKAIMDFVHKAQERYPEMTITSDDPLLHLDDGNPGCGGCGAGIANLAVLHDGTVYPCRRLSVPLGNVRETTLASIMDAEEGSILHQLRSREYFEGCGDCEHTWVCGGCRGAALALSGNALGKDPMCWLPKPSVSLAS